MIVTLVLGAVILQTTNKTQCFDHGEKYVDGSGARLMANARAVGAFGWEELRLANTNIYYPSLASTIQRQSILISKKLLLCIDDIFVFSHS